MCREKKEGKIWTEKGRERGPWSNDGNHEKVRDGQSKKRLPKGVGEAREVE